MERRDPTAWRVVVCLFAILFVGVADNQTLSPLLPAIRQDLGRSSQETGLLFTGYSLCAALSVLIWGPISDIFGRKRCLLVGLGIFSAGSVFSYFSHQFGLLLAGRVVTGAGASMLSLNTISYAADFFPYESRGWAMGTIFSSYFAALILGVPLGSSIGSMLGWNSVFLLAACSALLLLLAASALLPEIAGSRVRHNFSQLVAARLRSYAAFVTSRQTFAALTASLAASAGTMGFLAYIGVWLHDSHGIGPRYAGLVFIAAGAAALIASPFAGSLSDRVGKRPQFVASNLALASLLLLLPRLSWGIWLFVVFGAISVTTAFRQGPMEALMTEVVPPLTRGTFVALKNSFSQLGIAFSTALSGWLFDTWGYGAVCVVGAAVSLLAAVSMGAVGRGRRL